MTPEQREAAKAERQDVIESNKAWDTALLTELPGPRRGTPERRSRWTSYSKLLEGQVGLLAIGAVHRRATGSLPYVVVDKRGHEIEPFSAFLRDLILTDMSPLTVRSYGNDLLRWWRLLQLLGAPWERASRADVEVLVGWMRSAVNPQRRCGPGAAMVNARTGKQALAAGYAPATIDHTLAVLASFYARFGQGPVDKSRPGELVASGTAGASQPAGSPSGVPSGTVATEGGGPYPEVHSG